MLRFFIIERDMTNRNKANVYTCRQIILKLIKPTLAVLAIASFAVVAQNTTNPIQVDVIYPQGVQNMQTLVLTGTVEAKQHAHLAPPEAGRVAAINVEIGDIVTLGQTLLSLDSKLVELEVNAAQANVKAAKVNADEAMRLYQEVQKLSEQQVVAQTLIAERAAFLASTQAQLASVEASFSFVQERLNRHTLKAPFNGVIAQRNVDIGEWVSQQTGVITLVAQDDLRLTVAIPQQYFSSLSKQTDVAIEIKPDSSDAKAFRATLSRLVPVSDMQTRTFMAQIDLPNNTALVSGMSAVARISIPNSEQSSITLPRSAIKQHPDGGSSVFIVQNGVAKRIVTAFTSLPNNQVTINNQNTDAAFIISGVASLQDGTAIVPTVLSNTVSKLESVAR
jgi:RND family efflux transporter MFP subunit